MQLYFDFISWLSTLKIGMFLLGMAIGVFAGNLMGEFTSLNEIASYFSMIMLLSLVIYYFIAKRHMK